MLVGVGVMLPTLTKVLIVDAGSGLTTRRPTSPHVACKKRLPLSSRAQEAMGTRSSGRIAVIRFASRR